jgi:hypothetical protein
MMGCIVAGCVSIYDDRLGVFSNEDLLAPSSISVFPCIIWPKKHDFEKLENAKFDSEQALKACNSFDDFILKSFSGQPFMKGKTHRLVQKELTSSGKPEHIRALAEIIIHSEECKKCKGVQSFYLQSIIKNPAFIPWLEEFKKSIPSSDAILIPVISGHVEWVDDDRALPRVQRKASGSLLLIRISDVSTQWFGRRLGHQSRIFNLDEKIVPPEWPFVYEQIFTDSLWKDFPGRQYFRE